MSFATVYLAQLEAFAAERRLPRIRDLHLPPVRPIQDNRGEFCALELEDGSLGLSYVLLDDTLARLSNEIDNLGLPALIQWWWRAATPVTADCGRPLDLLPPMLSRVTCSTAQASARTIVPTP